MAAGQFPSLILSCSPRPAVTLPAVPPRIFISSSGSPRPVPNLPAAARSFSSGSLRLVVSEPDAWRCFSSTNADEKSSSDNKKFFVHRVECGTLASQNYPPLHHEYWIEDVGNGYEIRLYMCGVGKGNVRIRMLDDPVMMVIQGTKPYDFEDEDDIAKTLFWYKIRGPTAASTKHPAFKGQIKDGVLFLFLPYNY